MVHAIGGSKLVELSIACNPTITSRGWKTVPTLLEMPESNVEELNLSFNNFDNEEAFLKMH